MLAIALGLSACGPRGAAVLPGTAPDPAPPAEYVQSDTFVTPPPDAADMPRSTRPRLLGFLFKRTPGDAAMPPAAEDAADPAPETAPEVTAAAMNRDAAGDAPRRGWLSGLFGTGAAPEAAATPTAGLPVADLPFGDVVRVCGLPAAAMGTEVARSPGRRGYRLHDTDPASTTPRMQFITGFRDGCARQITASLAMFGSAQIHETTRYNPLNTNPYSPTDDAYETVKTRICRVGRGEFCPERRAARLDRDVVFLSVYRDFGDSDSWMELLLHKGELTAVSTLGG